MTFRPDKVLNETMSEGKKFIFYPRMSQQKTNFNQNQKKIGLKKAYVWVHPNSGC